jgi:hypothetical protein
MENIVHFLIQLYKLNKVNGRNLFSGPLYGELYSWFVVTTRGQVKKTLSLSNFRPRWLSCLGPLVLLLLKTFNLFCFPSCWLWAYAMKVIPGTRCEYLENTKETIKNGRQSRETGNMRYTRRRKTKQKHSTIYVGHNYTQPNTNNANQAFTLLQTTGGKDEPNIVYLDIYGIINKQKNKHQLIRNKRRYLCSYSMSVCMISYFCYKLTLFLYDIPWMTSNYENLYIIGE